MGLKRAYVDTKAEIEKQPDDDNWRKGAANLGCTQGLNQEKADQDGTSRADDGGRGDVGLDDI